MKVVTLKGGWRVGRGLSSCDTSKGLEHKSVREEEGWVRKSQIYVSSFMNAPLIIQIKTSLVLVKTGGQTFKIKK